VGQKTGTHLTTTRVTGLGGTAELFPPNPVTLEGLRLKLAEHNNPQYPNTSNNNIPPPRRPRRQKIIPNVSFIVSVKYCIDNFKVSYNLIFLFFPAFPATRKYG